MSRRRYLWAPVLLLAACASTPAEDPEPPTASRADVVRALQLQLKMVRDRQLEISAESTDAARVEEEHLSRLAAEIVIMLLRIDPEIAATSAN